jgi:hypothetical protein
MQSFCPACKGQISRRSLLVSRPQNVPWYKYSQALVYCPHCKVRLYQSTTVAGLLIMGLMLFTQFAVLIFFRGAPMEDLALVLIEVPLALALIKWGVVRKVRAPSSMDAL